MTVTEKELSALEDLLSGEQRMIAKCKAYGSTCDDPNLKQKCEMLAGKHQSHFDTLMTFLNEGGAK
jgi:hypothetical protein